MNTPFTIILFLFLYFKVKSKKNDDIFELNQNLRFCGADLLSKNIKLTPKKDVKRNNARYLNAVEYKPIRIFVDTTYFEYLGNIDPNLRDQVPIIKTALNKAVEGIKGLIKVEDRGNINYFKDIIPDLFTRNNIIMWDPIFDNGADIKSDFLIVVKFDIERLFPQGILASAVPIHIDPDTNRPLVGLLTITLDKSSFYLRRALEYFSEVLLHELTHALGFLYTMFPYFPNGDEGTYKTKIIRGVERTIIKTPKVLEISRKYFNCSRIDGIELEDQGMAGTAKSHWEQRILLGDYMGAVIYQEEMVISEITLALLEDSGWYKINYYTGGLMRFGKNKGCDFIENNCLDSNYNTKFANEFFDLSEAGYPSCSTGRQSRTYSILKEYTQIEDYKYQNYFFYDKTVNKYYSGSMYTTDYCFTHGQISNEAYNGFFTGNCKYGEGSYGYYIKYYNSDSNLYETGHPNSEFPEELGEIYSDTSFCIMSSLSPSGKYKLYNSVPHPMCYQIYCSSLSLTIRINKDFIVCPRNGGNVKLEGYDGFINCPDYNLMCSGTVICNDIFDCIEKKSLVKESSYFYDYKAQTTQKYSSIREIPIVESYELSENGFCPKNSAQCDINKCSKKCKEGYNGDNCNPISDDEDESKPSNPSDSSNSSDSSDSSDSSNPSDYSKSTDSSNSSDSSNYSIWILVSIISILILLGIGIAIYLIFKKKNVEKNITAIEMISNMKH